MALKGHTLIETVIVILLISLGGYTLHISKRYMQEATLNILAKEVEQGIISAQQMAVSTGRQYNIYCLSNRILIRQGVEAPIYKINMPNEVTIPSNITGKWIRFEGKIAPSKAGTIELVHNGLRKSARITVRVATGKTTIYFDP